MMSCAWDALISIDSHQRLGEPAKWREFHDLIFFRSFATLSNIMTMTFFLLPQITHTHIHIHTQPPHPHCLGPSPLPIVFVKDFLDAHLKTIVIDIQRMIVRV